MLPGNSTVTYKAPSFKAGKNSLPRRGISATAPPSTPPAKISTISTFFMAKRIVGSNARWAQVSSGESRMIFGFFSAIAHSTGTSVKLTKSAPTRALTTV